MSIKNHEEVRCPCGEVFEPEIYQSVSVEKDPKLKNMILAGEFNLVKCPACFRVIYAETFILYHDHSQELLAFVYPLPMEQRKMEIQKEADKKFLELQNSLPTDQKFSYQPVLIFGLDQLCQLLAVEEERLDEAQIVDSLCHSLQLTKKRIRFSEARRIEIPPLLPMTGNGHQDHDFRKSLLHGLRKIIQKNDRLIHYRKFLEVVDADPHWIL